MSDLFVIVFPNIVLMWPPDRQELGDMVTAKTVFVGYFIRNLSEIYAYLGDGRVFIFCPQAVLLLQMLPR